MTSRTTLIIGGTSGVGLAAARQLAAAGETVHVASRDAAKVATITDTAPELVAHQVDGNDAAAVAGLVAGLAPLDALVITLAGSEGAGALADLDLTALRRAFEAKFWPTLTVLQAALPHLAERASITLVGAVSAHAAMPGTAGIGALNAAVEALVRPLAVELAPRRVNAVSPGLIDTPWWSGMPEQARAEWFSSAAKGLPVGHVSSADEIAEAVVLASTNTSMTGAVLNIDGGARLVQF
ncbi:SDR family oxidoreductase [Streptomyces sp. NPDC047000]|uniref:SDR family oxidoreductase n=1 Tax=Streptomyces sp. NPDC047000 TaxID=3155474 RepID=UPI003407CBA4